MHNLKLYNIKENNLKRKNNLQVSLHLMMIENKNVEICKHGKKQWVLMENKKFLLSKVNILI